MHYLCLSTNDDIKSDISCANFIFFFFLCRPFFIRYEHIRVEDKCPTRKKNKQSVLKQYGRCTMGFLPISRNQNNRRIVGTYITILISCVTASRSCIVSGEKIKKCNANGVWACAITLFPLMKIIEVFWQLILSKQLLI